MNSYNKTFEDTIGSYSGILSETRELYTKYTLNMKLASGARTTISDSELDALKRQIINESKLRFDLINNVSGFQTKNEFVKVTKKEIGTAYEENEYALFEERLKNFIMQKTKSIIFLKIPDETEAKLNFLLLGNGADMPVEILINVGEGSRLSLFEWFGSAPCSSLIVPSHAINIGKNSNVEVNMLHNEDSGTEIGALNAAKVLDNSTLKLNFIYNGGSVTKSTTFVDAAGKNSKLLVNEIVLGNAEQKFDINTFIFNSNKSTSAMLSSGAVLKDKSLCTLRGYAKVAKNAKESYSNINERGLLMGPDARIQSLPDMSIRCRDIVLASHSAATAPIDKEALFYLMTRGIDEEKARRVFVAGFLSDYLGNIENDIVKEIAISILLDKLDNGTFSQVPKISAKNFWVVPSKK